MFLVESRRSFLQRNFTKMGTGSMRGSIFALCASAIGSGWIYKIDDNIGVLTFPSIFKDNGWLFGTILILMGGLSCWRS